MRILFLLLAFLLPTTVHAACVNPAGNAGEQLYNSTHNVMQYCNGTDWTAMRGTLNHLNCSTGQIAKWNGTAWACAADGGGTETDPTVPASIKDGISWGEVSGKPAGFADGIDNEGITAETDPKVGATTTGKWCQGTGSQVTCDQDAPSGGGGTMIAGFPDAIKCSWDYGGNRTSIFYHHGGTSTGDHEYSMAVGSGTGYVTFDNSGNYTTAWYTTTCNGKSISTLYAEGNAYNLRN